MHDYKERLENAPTNYHETWQRQQEDSMRRKARLWKPLPTPPQKPIETTHHNLVRPDWDGHVCTVEIYYLFTDGKPRQTLATARIEESTLIGMRREALALAAEKADFFKGHPLNNSEWDLYIEDGKGTTRLVIKSGIRRGVIKIVKHAGPIKLWY